MSAAQSFRRNPTIVLLSGICGWLDRRIDARIQARAEADKKAANLKWWNDHSERDKRRLVETFPRLLKDEVVAAWVAGQSS